MLNLLLNLYGPEVEFPFDHSSYHKLWAKSFFCEKTKIIEINEYINIKPCIIDHGFLGFEHETFALTP